MIIYEEILSEFQRQKIRYLIVGGIAVNLLGSLRTTSDLDILVEMSDKNLIRIVNILKKHGYYVKQPIDPIKIADKETREDWIGNKHMKAFNFYKGKADLTLQEVDIIIDSPVSFKDAIKHAGFVKAGKIRLPVISIDDLIKMKRRSARSIDKVDIEELKRIKRLRKNDLSMGD